MASSKLSFTFRIFRGDRLVREERLSQAVIKIGKVPSAHLRIDDESVSRMHAIIEVSGSEVSIIDLGSTRGTFVNGQKINKARLHTGDAIGLGDSRVEIAINEPAVVIAEAIAPAAPAPAVAAPVARAATPPPAPVAIRAAAPVPPPVPRAPTVAPPAAFAATLAAAADDTSAKAVEVAAMLGDSVVDVKHCMDPRAGKVTRTTWALAAGGLACLLASASAFYVSIDTAARNKAALDYHTRTLHKPAYSFRPRDVGAPVSWLAFGGLALGLAASASALARARAERRSPFYRIGTAPGVEQAIEGAPAESFPLVAPSGDDFVFNYGAGIEGELILDGRSTSLAELAATGRARPSTTAVGAVEIPIPAASKIRARAGQTTFLVSAVARPKRQAASMLAMLESRPLKYAAGSLVAHLGIVLLLSQVAVEDSGVNISLASKEALSTRAQVTGQEDPTKPEPEKTEATESGDGAAQVDQAMALPEGRSGDPKQQADKSQLQVANNNVDPRLAREQEIEAARAAGILGSTQLRDSISALTATDAFSSGFDGSTIYGAYDGVDGPGSGNFGTGRSGDGRGGGCLVEPCGIIGTGRYRTIPGGKYGPDGWPGGSGTRILRDRIAAVPRYSYPTDVTGGGLDKSIIKRYIKRNEASIGYCYEKELLAHPGLSGTVAIQFLISGDGTVQSAGGQGFDNNVASCVSNVIKHINFPAPKDGLAVTVNYPFTFRAAGQ